MGGEPYGMCLNSGMGARLEGSKKDDFIESLIDGGTYAKLGLGLVVKRVSTGHLGVVSCSDSGNEEEVIRLAVLGFGVKDVGKESGPCTPTGFKTPLRPLPSFSWS